MIAKINAINTVLKSDPFKQGLDIEDAIALTKTKRAPSKDLQRKYHKTEHFQRLKATAIAIQLRCQVCHRPNDDKAGLTFHHVGYGNFFREDVLRDGLVVCRRCHRKLHGKG